MREPDTSAVCETLVHEASHLMAHMCAQRRVSPCISLMREKESPQPIGARVLYRAGDAHTMFVIDSQLPWAAIAHLGRGGLFRGRDSPLAGGHSKGRASPVTSKGFRSSRRASHFEGLRIEGIRIKGLHIEGLHHSKGSSITSTGFVALSLGLSH